MMKILDELKHQVTLKMVKPTTKGKLSSNDKVLLLTKVLYDKLSMFEVL
jgi:hypothetical protein